MPRQISYHPIWGRLRSKTTRFRCAILPYLKVWWHNATFFIYLFIILRHTVIYSSTQTSHSLRMIQISSSLSLSRGISNGMPGRDSNPGLLYSRPTHYYLSTPHHINPAAWMHTSDGHFLTYLHSVMMAFSAQLGDGGGGCTPSPFHSIYRHHSSYVSLSIPFL